ncbi:unnamed protein product, partial [marine sediment metagenome]
IYCLVRGLFIEYMPALFFGSAYGYFIIWAFARGGTKHHIVELAVDGEWILIVLFIIAIKLLR